MSQHRKAFGQKGEELTVEYLKQHEYSIIAQNVTSKYGEIDIIAQKAEVLAFVEVKFRKNTKISLSDLINFSKQQKIIKTALWYISENNFSHIVYRFDVALLHLTNDTIELNYIQNAFTAHE